jgi:carbonic anhydrase/acetyltransferase-like protein (isoleucine patch superfamily)
MENRVPFKGKAPRVEEEVYIDPSARLMGDVLVKAGASVWPMAVLRADTEAIVVEEGAAVLDKALIEAPGPGRVVVGRRALVSHGAILHGCTIGEGAIVGIGAIVLDGAVVGAGATVGAGAVVPPGTVIPDRSLVLGVPGKVVRPLRPGEVERTASQVEEVREKAAWYRKGVGGELHPEIV